MKGINNINRKTLITIFTFLFLIRFIYSEYPIGISPQNNAVSSLGSNSIIQWIINSSVNGYSTVAQYIANFISIKGIPTYVWTLITFLMTTLLFIAIYLYIFEIFTQRVFTQKGMSESETMKKAKILFVFALGVFSAIAIGYAIPFLFNLYGFILLILLLIALFFFGRATISYGKSFHYAAKSLADNVEKDYREIENELKKTKQALSSEENEYLEEKRKEIATSLQEIRKILGDADKKYDNILSTIKNEREEFIDKFIEKYNEAYKNTYDNLAYSQKQELENLIKEVHKIKKDIQQFPTIRQLNDHIFKQILNLKLLGYNEKIVLQRLLNDAYNNTNKQDRIKILNDIDEALKEYTDAKNSLIELDNKYKSTIKKNIGSRFRKLLSVSDKLEEDIRETENSINEHIRILKNLKNLL